MNLNIFVGVVQLFRLILGSTGDIAMKAVRSLYGQTTRDIKSVSSFTK